MEKVWFRLPLFIMREKHLASRHLEGRVIRYTAKGILAKVRAIVEPSDYCMRCGREITHPASLLVGYGPECSQHLGIPRDFPPHLLEDVIRKARIESEMELWLPRRYAFDADGQAWTPSDEDLRHPQVQQPSGLGMTITRDGDAYVVGFQYNREVVDAVKAIPGRRYNPMDKTWTVPSQHADKLFAVYEKYMGRPAPEDVRGEHEKVQAQAARRIAASKATDAKITIPGLGGELMPFQRAGVMYAMQAKRAIFGDEMGLGKTVQALATVQAVNAYPAIIVVPASVKLNWEREAQKWLPGKTVRVLNGQMKRRTRADVTILNYDILKKHMDFLKKLQPKAIVFDEMHYVKNGQAQRSKLAKELAEGVEYVYGLTGTLSTNRPNELVHPLTIIGKLESFGGYNQFIKRYCEAYKGRFGMDTSGASNLVELNEKLRSICYVRREKKDVLTDMPDKRKAIVSVPITNRAEYQRALDDLITYLKDEAVRNQEFLDSIAHLRGNERQAAISRHRASTEQRAMAAEHLVRINALKKLTARGKMKAITEWIEDFLSTGEKLVVFGHHKEMVQGLAAKFNAPYIDGSRTAQQRQDAVDRFQNDASCKLIVLNMQAGGVGLTLTAASNVVFTELAWTPALHKQAEDRCHRIGQKNAVTAWYLLAHDTMDEEIAELLDKKQVITDAINIGEEIDEQVSILHELIDNIVKRG